MMFECQECYHKFSEREAKCLDWRNPAKKFICPNCDVALAKPESHILNRHAFGMDLTPKAGSITSGLIRGLLCLFLPLWLLIQYQNIYAIMLLVAGVIVFSIKTGVEFNKLESRPFKVKKYND